MEEVFSLFARLIEKTPKSEQSNYFLNSIFKITFNIYRYENKDENEKKIKNLRKKKDQILRLIEQEKKGVKLEKNQVNIVFRF